MLFRCKELFDCRHDMTTGSQSCSFDTICTLQGLLRWRLLLGGNAKLAFVCMNYEDIVDDNDAWTMCTEFEAVIVMILPNINCQCTNELLKFLSRSTSFIQMTRLKKVAMFVPGSINHILMHQNNTKIALSDNILPNALLTQTRTMYYRLINVYIYMAFVIRPRTVLIDHVGDEQIFCIQYALSSIEVHSGISKSKRIAYTKYNDNLLSLKTPGEIYGLEATRVIAYNYKFMFRARYFLKKNMGVMNLYLNKWVYVSERNSLSLIYTDECSSILHRHIQTSAKLYNYINNVFNFKFLFCGNKTNAFSSSTLDVLVWQNPALNVTEKRLVFFAFKEHSVTKTQCIDAITINTNYLNIFSSSLCVFPPNVEYLETQHLYSPAANRTKPIDWKLLYLSVPNLNLFPIQWD